MVRVSNAFEFLCCFSLIAAVFSAANGEIIDIPDYWPDLGDDLTDVTWSHGTNSIKELDDALNDPDIMMIEADVNLGYLEGQPQEGDMIPIMAHPPTTVSDLSLEAFMQTAVDVILNGGKKKGIKLDFKTIDVVEDSLKIMQTFEIAFPVWLNADILSGPGDSKSIKLTPNGKLVDPDSFIPLCQQYFPTSTLSTGWVTGGINPNAEYSLEMVAEMLNTLQVNNIGTQTVTFPVRALFVANSEANLQALLDKSEDQKGTLTIWGKDPIRDVDSLRDTIDRIGRDRIYLDVPEFLLNEIGQCKEDLCVSHF